MAASKTTGKVGAALVTPPGSGGIGVIIVRGRGAGRVISKVFRPKSGADWLRARAGTLHYGHICDGGNAADEVLVRRAQGDGEEAVEINCHGGIAAVGEVMRLLVESGAEETDAAEARDGVHGAAGMDGVQREAMRLLPGAQSRLAVRMLCDQANGALSRAIRSIDAAAPDAAKRLESLVRSAEFGLALTEPRRVALVGPPNAGKSTLFNALVGFERTIVSRAPGTTRDFVTECVEMGGYPVELVDTAGLRERGGAVEMKGVGATWRVLAGAWLAVFIVDGSRPLTAAERRLLVTVSRRRPIVAVNKSDLRMRLGGESLPEDVGRLSVSGLTGDGLAELERAILARFPQAGEYPPGSPVVFTAEQRRSIRAALAQCRARQTRRARATLDALLA